MNLDSNLQVQFAHSRAHPTALNDTILCAPMRLLPGFLYALDQPGVDKIVYELHWHSLLGTPWGFVGDSGCLKVD